MPADRGSGWSRRELLLTGLGGGLVLAGCGQPSAGSGPGTGTPTDASSPPIDASATPAPSPSGTPSASSPSPSTTPRPTSTATSGTPRAEPGPSLPDRLRLTDDRRNAFAFAPLDRPTAVTVEGRVSATQAWSTSKVLVVAAFLDRVARGDPGRISDRDARLITAALTASDAGAVTAVRDQIPGRPGAAMTAVLRSIGDRTTVAPDTYQGLMRWSLREQVRFLAALNDGRIASRRASAYLLKAMRPIRAHAWGLGRVGARSYKGGWLRADTATRQFGLLDGYAVALITTAGPAVRQTDGDSAHVQGIDRLARLLAERLTYERRR